MFYIKAYNRFGNLAQRAVVWLKETPMESYVTDENGVSKIDLPAGMYSIGLDAWDNGPYVFKEDVIISEGATITIGGKTVVVQSKKKANWFTELLCKIFPYKEIGWKEIGETFYRWTIFECRWFKVVLHKLDAPNWHPQCHDHPWDFWAFIIWPGYWEKLDPKQKLKNTGQHCGGNVYWRRPLTILYRPAASKHNVITPVGTPSWSIVVMTNKKRNWGMLDCD